MLVSAAGLDVIAEEVVSRDPLYCLVSQQESSRLFHQASVIGSFFRDYIFPLSNIRASDQTPWLERGNWIATERFWSAPFNSFFRQVSTAARFFREYLFSSSNAPDPHKTLLDREDWISTELFWSAPFGDLRYPRQQEVRENFERYNQKVVIQSEGKKIEMNCRVIETKGCPKTGCLNHILVQGNVSTLDNNMPGLYPLLETYLKEKERNPELPPARFIMVNHYGNKISYDTNAKDEDYYPENLDEWGLVFKKTIESLVNQYGELNLLAAHSLGNIPVVQHLNNLNDEEFLRLFPKTLFLAQGPSSLYEVSANVPASFEWYPWGRTFVIGWVVYYFFKWIGWDVKLDSTLVERLQRLPKNTETVEKLRRTNIVVTDVVHDFYFPGKASLCASDKLQELEGIVNISRMTFNPPLSWGIPRAQHNYNIGLLQRQDLVKEKLCYVGHEVVHLRDPKEIVNTELDLYCSLHHGESLVHAVMRSAWSESLSRPSPNVARKVVPISVPTR